MADIEALTSMISGLESKSAYSRLKPLMPTIDRKIKDGVRRAEIHAMLTAHGIEISAGSFNTYLWRYRKNNVGTVKPAPKSVSWVSLEQQGTDVKDLQVDQEARSTTVGYEPPTDDLLTNSEARERYAEQFFTRPSILRKNR